MQSKRRRRVKKGNWQKQIAILNELTLTWKNSKKSPQEWSSSVGSSAASPICTTKPHAFNPSLAKHDCLEGAQQVPTILLSNYCSSIFKVTVKYKCRKYWRLKKESGIALSVASKFLQFCSFYSCSPSLLCCRPFSKGWSKTEIMSSICNQLLVRCSNRI